MKRVVMMGVLAAGFVLYVISPAHAWPWSKKKVEEKPKAAEEVAEAPAAANVEEAAMAEAPEAGAPVKPAEEAGEVKEEARPAAPPQPPIDPKELERKRILKEKRRKAIDGNQWEISVIPMTGKGEKTLDVLLFDANKFSSQEYGKKGYAPSNYTVSIADDGTTVVETMQSDEKMGILFWRIEFDQDHAGCRGVISRQISENVTDDYSFVSTAKKPIVK